MATKKQIILKSLRDDGPANVVELNGRIDTDQTPGQLSSYLSVLRLNDEAVEFDRETMRWSITETGEQYLAKKSAPATKNKTTVKAEKPAPATETNQQAQPEEPGPIIAYPPPADITDRSLEPSPPTSDDIKQPLTPARPELPTAGSFVDRVLSLLAKIAGHQPPSQPAEITPQDIAQEYSYNIGSAIECLLESKHPADQVDQWIMARDFIDREIERIEASR